MNETEQQEIDRLKGRRLSKDRCEGHCRRGGQGMSKASRAKIARRGGQVVVLKYGIEYMRQLGRKGGLKAQAQLREELNGEESEGL
jgi:hypothetical protein